MLIEVGGFSTSAAQSAALIERVRADMQALGGPDRYAPGMRVGFTGDVAISAEETAALVEDLTVSSVLVVVDRAARDRRCSTAGVAASRRCSCRWASRRCTRSRWRACRRSAITELNSNTAFLGSIIIGNGINFGIIQLARYVEARRHGETVEDALALALWGTRKGTLSAALAAGVAYASLVAMQFRGFRQFGVIGGLGMLLAWATTYRADAAADRLAGSRPVRAQAPVAGARPHGADRARAWRPARACSRRPPWCSRCSPPGRCAGSGATSWSTTSRACAGTTPGRRARATGAGRWTCCSTAT